MFVIGYFGAKHRDVNQLAFFVFFGGLCTLGSGLVSVLYFLELFSGEMSASEQKECDLDPACTEEMKSGGMRTHPIVSRPEHALSDTFSRACPADHTALPSAHSSPPVHMLRAVCCVVAGVAVERWDFHLTGLRGVGCGDAHATPLRQPRHANRRRLNSQSHPDDAPNKLGNSATDQARKTF